MRIQTKAVILVIIATSVLIGLFVLIRALLYMPEPENMIQDFSLSMVATTSVPVRLIIPVIDVDASVQTVGLTAKGAMGIPTNFTEVGWYKYGSVPGQMGSAVIDGHVDNGLGLAAVFKRLADLKKGDDVQVVTKGGTILHFRVIDRETYQYQHAPVHTIFNREGGVYLNLITCDGVWISGEKTYDRRLVVYTERVMNL